MKEDKVYLKYKEFAKQYKLSNYDTKKLWKTLQLLPSLFQKQVVIFQ